MACHEKGFSNYQREAIDRVKALIGDTPFEYEKSANNHLRVTISGIERIFFTGSTPSDTRSIDNFMGDIRGELNKIKASKFKGSTPKLPPKSVIKANERKSAQKFMSDTTESIKKNIKYEIERIKKDEEEMLIESGGCDNNLGQNIRDFRKNLIKSKIDKILESKGKLFIPPGLIKKCHGQLDDYLATLLPKIPEYKNGILDKVYSHTLTGPKEVVVIKDKPQLEKTPEPEPEPELKKPLLVETPITEQDSMDNTLASLVDAKSNKRVAMIKTLPKQKIMALIEDFQKALAQKHQDDIQFLAEQMQSRGISLSELKTALEN